MLKYRTTRTRITIRAIDPNDKELEEEEEDDEDEELPPETGQPCG